MCARCVTVMCARCVTVMCARCVTVMCARCVTVMCARCVTVMCARCVTVMCAVCCSRRQTCRWLVQLLPSPLPSVQHLGPFLAGSGTNTRWVGGKVWLSAKSGIIFTSHCLSVCLSRPRSLSSLAEDLDSLLCAARPTLPTRWHQAPHPCAYPKTCGHVP